MKNYILKVTYYDGYEITRDEFYCVSESTKQYIIDENKHLDFQDKLKARQRALDMCYLYNTIDDDEMLFDVSVPSIKSGAQSEDEENDISQALQFIYNKQI